MRRKTIAWSLIGLLVLAAAAGGWWWRQHAGRTDGSVAAGPGRGGDARAVADGAGGRGAAGRDGQGGGRGAEGRSGEGRSGDGRGTEGRSAGGRGPGGRGAGPGGFDPNRAVPVRTALVRRGDLAVTLDGLGTASALNTVTVRSRVDGQLVRIAFREGQQVRAGDVLAEIDPRPFQAALDQVNGQLARDQALLANARIDVQRYRSLLAKDAIARQQVDAQESLVRQYEGAVQADRAQVDAAALQLKFTRVTAPVSGRLGLRQVDVGNMVRATDTNGIVVLTQTRPMTVVFPIPQASLSPVLAALRAGSALPVEALDRDGATRLATGRLLTVDNLIDPATGTVKLKAQFDNADDALFPNQFVVARLRVGVRRDATLVPSAAVQRGTPGTFVYLVKPDRTVTVRPVTLGAASGDAVAVDEGLAPGDEVVIDGTDKLREGSRIEAIGAAPGAAARSAPTAPAPGGPVAASSAAAPAPLAPATSATPAAPATATASAR